MQNFVFFANASANCPRRWGCPTKQQIPDHRGSLRRVGFRRMWKGARSQSQKIRNSHCLRGSREKRLCAFALPILRADGRQKRLWRVWGWTQKTPILGDWKMRQVWDGWKGEPPSVSDDWRGEPWWLRILGWQIGVVRKMVAAVLGYLGLMEIVGESGEICLGNLVLPCVL